MLSKSTAMTPLSASLDFDAVEDPEEETFLLYTQNLPSQNLGFVDNKAKDLQVAVADRDFEIIQSPSVLSSDREGGTTGAILWQITPLIAEWMRPDTNILFQADMINKESIVIELGCGMSGILAATVAPYVRKYLATDQSYVSKVLSKNIKAHSVKPQHARRGKAQGSEIANNIEILVLDWEDTDISSLQSVLPEESEGVDIIIACDCVYNESLVEPLLNTCVELCRLRSHCHVDDIEHQRPTACLLAHQLRSSTVFETWLSAFLRYFTVYRFPESHLDIGLKHDSGFVVYLAILKEETKWE